MSKTTQPQNAGISPLRHIKVELHIIQNFPPSCLNRDDTGMPKECLFGGVRRARVSSQCLKRWMRDHFEQTGREIGVRTRELRSEMRDIMHDDLTEERREQLNEVLNVFISLYYSAMAPQKPQTTKVPLFVGRAEMHEIAKCVNELWEPLLQEANARQADVAEAKAAKDATRKFRPRPKKEVLTADKTIDERLKSAQRSLDLALFGRMMAEKPTKNVDGSCQVAHAISTHRVHPELDYFTTVDDVTNRRMKQARSLGLSDEDTTGPDFFAAADSLDEVEANDTDDTGSEEDDVDEAAEDAVDSSDESGASSGAAMLGLIGFNSACYYRYLLLDCDELARNIQAPSGELSDADLESNIRAFFEAAIETIPQAKRTSMAQQTRPDCFVFVVRHQGAPASLVNAFAEPVRLEEDFEDSGSDQNIIGKSIARLDNYWAALTDVYGTEGITGVIAEPGFHRDRFHVLNDFVVQKSAGETRGRKDIALDQMIELVRRARAGQNAAHIAETNEGATP